MRDPWGDWSNALIDLMEKKLGIDHPADMAITCLYTGVRLMRGFQRENTDPEVPIAAMVKLMRQMLESPQSMNTP